jgi:hypothetical protein
MMMLSLHRTLRTIQVETLSELAIKFNLQTTTE